MSSFSCFHQLRCLVVSKWRLSFFSTLGVMCDPRSPQNHRTAFRVFKITTKSWKFNAKKRDMDHIWIYGFLLSQQKYCTDKGTTPSLSKKNGTSWLILFNCWEIQNCLVGPLLSEMVPINGTHLLNGVIKHKPECVTVPFLLVLTHFCILIVFFVHSW